MAFGPSEEQLRDINHISHRDGAREGFAVAMLICGPGFVVLIQSGLSGFVFYFLWVCISAVGVVSGLLIKRWIGGMAAREQASIKAEFREERAREKQRQMAEMKARDAEKLRD